MKRIFTMLLALIMVLTLLPGLELEAQAVETLIDSGECGETLIWEMYDQGTIRIFGNGRMYDYTIDSVPWAEYRSSITRIHLESGVTHIGSYAFYGCTSYYSVTMPDTLLHIGDYAFTNCGTNDMILLPDSVQTIGDSAFRGNPQAAVRLSAGLVSIGDYALAGTRTNIPTVSESVTYIGKRAFANCTYMSLLRIRSKNITIDDEAFSGCTNLKEIHCYGNVPQFGKNVFAGVNAEVRYLQDNPDWTQEAFQNYGGILTYKAVDSGEVDQGECGRTDSDEVYWSLAENGRLTLFGNGAVQDFNVHTTNPNWNMHRENIKTVVVEEGVTYIGEGSFKQYPNLESVTLANSVKGVGVSSFYGCPKLSRISFGSNMAYVGENAFGWCDSLTRVELPKGDVQYASRAFYNCDNLTEVIIPETQTSLGSQMFRACDSLTSITIPTSVTRIGAGAFRATGITNITIPDSVTEIGAEVFVSCDNLTEVKLPAGYPALEMGMFGFCKKMTSYSIPDSVKRIERQAFEFTGLTSLTIPENVTYIGRDVFRCCNDLKTITFLGDAPTFDESAFRDIRITAYYPEDNDTWAGGVRQDYDGTIIWIPIHIHRNTSTVTEPTCTTQGYTTHVCDTCGEKVIDSYVPALGHTWDDADAIVRNCTACGYHFEGHRIGLSGDGLEQAVSAWVDGVEYPLERDTQGYYVRLSQEDATNLVIYSYNDPNAQDIHTQYPTGMKVWILEFENGAYSATYVKEFDNLLQYSGSSIRIVGKKGIRMITSLTKDNKNALIGKGLAGFTLQEYGTALCFASEIQEGDALILGREFTRSNYAYKKDVNDPVFASPGNLIQYTNVLVGFTQDQCKEDIAMRPYIILKDGQGNQITLYGGTIYRSIGYIAYQNRTVFQPKTNAYDFVWEIIHHVYGDQYDADYKG